MQYPTPQLSSVYHRMHMFLFVCGAPVLYLRGKMKTHHQSVKALLQECKGSGHIKIACLCLSTEWLLSQHYAILFPELRRLHFVLKVYTVYYDLIHQL